MGILRNLILAGGLGLSLPSAYSYAQESLTDSIKDLLESTKKATGELKENAANAKKAVKNQIDQVREQARQFARRNSLQGLVNKTRDIKEEAEIAGVKRLVVYDPNSGNFVTLNNYFRTLTGEYPEMFAGTDWEKDPVRTAMAIANNPLKLMDQIKIYDVLSDSWVTPNQAIELLRNQTTISTQTRSSMHTAQAQKSLETIIDKEFKIGTDRNDINHGNLYESIELGDKILKLYSRTVISGGMTGEDPILLDIICEDSKADSRSSKVSLISERDKLIDMAFSDKTADANVPVSGAEYTIYDNEGCKLKLKIINCYVGYSDSGRNKPDKVIKGLTVRVQGTKEIQQTTPIQPDISEQWQALPRITRPVQKYIQQEKNSLETILRQGFNGTNPDAITYEHDYESNRQRVILRWPRLDNVGYTVYVSENPDRSDKHWHFLDSNETSYTFFIPKGTISSEMIWIHPGGINSYGLEGISGRTYYFDLNGRSGGSEYRIAEAEVTLPEYVPPILDRIKKDWKLIALLAGIGVGGLGFLTVSLKKYQEEKQRIREELTKLSNKYKK